VNEDEARELREETGDSGTENTELHNQLADAKARAGSHVQAVGAVDIDALYQTIKARLVKEAPSLLRVLTDKPELRVTVERRTRRGERRHAPRPHRPADRFGILYGAAGGNGRRERAAPAGLPCSRRTSTGRPTSWPTRAS
jgi:hypothetical protein